MGGEEEASEQCAEEVVAVAGAQRLLPTARTPAPAQSELAKEKQGWWSEMMQKEGWVVSRARETAGLDQKQMKTQLTASSFPKLDP